MEAIITRKYQALSRSLNERQRRLWAAAEVMSLGYGGLAIVSRTTSISHVTIRQGIRELEEEWHLPPE